MLRRPLGTPVSGLRRAVWCNRNRAPSSLYAIYIVPLHLGLIPGPGYLLLRRSTRNLSDHDLSSLGKGLT